MARRPQSDDRTVNEALEDFAVYQQTLFLDHANEAYRDARNDLDESDALLAALLLAFSFPVTKSKLSRLKQQVNEILRAAHDQIAPKVRTTVRNVAQEAASAEARIFARLVFGLNVASPNPGIVATQTFDTPYQGGTVAQWISDLRQGDLKRSWRTILTGLLDGTPTPDIVAQLRGSRPLRYRDGIREITRRGLKTLVRTATNHAQSQGRQHTWEENEDLIIGVRWVSTLDTRTTPICRHRDGRVGPVRSNPNWEPPPGTKRLEPIMARPPAHPNCRSTTVPVLKSWQDLGLDLNDAPQGTRASMDGQVPADLTYYLWLRRQPAAVQREVLGATRYDLWKKQGIRPERFHHDDGRLLTLDELKVRTNAAIDRL